MGMLSEWLEWTSGKEADPPPLSLGGKPPTNQRAKLVLIFHFHSCCRGGHTWRQTTSPVPSSFPQRARTPTAIPPHQKSQAILQRCASHSRAVRGGQAEQLVGSVHGGGGGGGAIGGHARGGAAGGERGSQGWHAQLQDEGAVPRQEAAGTWGDARCTLLPYGV